MGAEEHGLTLEGLAQRLQALERENAELRNEVVALRGSDTRRNEPAETSSLVPLRDGEQTSGFEGPVSRRALLGKAGAAAVAAMAAGMLLNPREANAHHFFTSPDEDVFTANEVHAHFFSAEINNEAAPGIESLNDGSGPGVWGRSVRGTGVQGIANAITGVGVEGTATGSLGYGIRGTGFSGVWGESDKSGGRGVMGVNSSTDGTGVRGVTNNTDGRTGVRGEGATGVWGSSSKTGFSGVYGQHTGSSGYGIVGDGKGGSAGVLGRNSGGEGVRGEGSTSAEVAGVRGLGTTGVWGSSSRTGYSGLYGEHTGTAGYGVVGDGTGDTGAGILGRNGSGYGGQFEGGKAQLMLKPGASAGKPTSGTHTKGEIYMDSAGTLFVCTAGNGTTVGRWKQVNMKLI